MADRSPGTLHGLGVGPGDPDLITVKGRELLRRVPVIAYLHAEGQAGIARGIAAPHLPGGRIEIPMPTPMVPGDAPAEAVYDKGAEAIAVHLEAGRDVAFLCEGDPLFHGSFMYLLERLRDRFPVRVVPGVSSLAACAAAASWPLASRNEVLTVLPAPLDEDRLAARLSVCDTAAIMKVGRHLPKVRRVLKRLGLLENSRYVARVGMGEEIACPLAEAPEQAPYFAMILVRGRAAAPPVPAGVALLSPSPGGRDLARRLAGRLPEASVEDFTALEDLFRAGRPIVGVCAAGILIRKLAPLLADKRAEPPVVAVAEDGSAAVPLLGGHRGANRLARAVAVATGGQAAITTAGEVGLGLALDDPPPGWTVANPGAAKAVAAALLAGEPVGLTVEAGEAPWLEGFAADGVQRVRVTDRMAEGEALTLHPPVLALGVGCERNAPPEELAALVAEILDEAGLAKGAVACVASIDVKMDEAAVNALAEAMGKPLRFFAAADLEAETPRLANPSETVFKAVGCHGVAEAAALAAAGPEAELVVAKTRSARATVAVARAPRDIDPSAVGMARGRLTVVGVGPGTPDWRTPHVTRTLREATDVVGYGLYLDLIADLTGGKRLHESPMTQEEARVRMALDLAAEGRRVALVCSGDAGIYALAALTFELLDREDRADWNRLDISVAPGISAFQAAASRIGAPFGHDFCLISLSDLLTPWKDIERRLEAAAEGDFVVAFYNPVSKRRRTQLAAARDILLARRPAETPVILARNLGRPEETIRVVALGDLTPDHADMLTLVVVGSSNSRHIRRGGRDWVYTPRGYEAKMAGKGD
jgi:cobalt-precorrin 5A hydrolase/precorrin-3B C17-methyltransferase